MIALASWAYLPGLHGDFLFDDYINLPALGADGPISHWATFWRYVTSGQADPTGRPLALLSFLLDAHDWPAAPYPFKRTNLLLHLLNGTLLAGLLYRLGQLRFEPFLKQKSHTDTQRIATAAVLGAAFWLLHPLFVSTTLYIVQREAMLPTTFTLLGLLLWLHGRSIILRGQRYLGLAWIIIGLCGGTLLGMLSKANGILLPALALLIEHVILQAPGNANLQRPHGSTREQSLISDDPSQDSAQQLRFYRHAMLPLAWFPTVLIAGYLVYAGWYGFTQDISAVRSWTLGQRLLTEPRILVDYLKLLWFPRPFTAGLFNDQIRASTSIWAPATTLPSLLAISTLIAGAWLYRQRWPIVAVAVLFYFVGQSMESSTIALELYFEHRNYLPAALMFWPLALWLCSVKQSTPYSPALLTHPTSNIQRWLKIALATVLLICLATMTHASSELWGNGHDQALLWAALNPDSPRAQASAAMAETNAGHPERAVARLRPLLATQPDQIQLALNLFSAACLTGHVDVDTLDATTSALRTTRDTGSLLTSWFERAIDQSSQPACPELTLTTATRMLEATLSNPNLVKLPGRRQDLYFLQGRIALKQGDADIALADFNRALDQQVRAPAALRQAALLGASGYPSQGLAHLDHYEANHQHEDRPGLGMPRIHAWVLQHQQYWENELIRLRNTLLTDERAKNPSAK
ncbi:tetratricopeptide repeat protein [Dyella sp. OK004]|uniref:tetratricopeptide repeat protein n=1 Tax=Dyella sp. OK004 TaxID=1855292 RepID=UPI0021013B06|nr:tetratricopeptide repeat protein [Dyella sp. OK004]